jgi:hypothetical protein
MDQFGVHMHFLQIKQVLTFIYALKTNFCFIFYGFTVVWTGHNNTGKSRDDLAKIPRHGRNPQRTSGYFNKNPRALL